MSSLNRLGNVLAKDNRVIAEIDTVNTNGTTTVTFSDGTKSTVIGDSVTTGNVYIKDGVVIGAAATLPYSEIWV